MFLRRTVKVVPSRHVLCEAAFLNPFVGICGQTGQVTQRRFRSLKVKEILQYDRELVRGKQAPPRQPSGGPRRQPKKVASARHPTQDQRQKKKEVKKVAAFKPTDLQNSPLADRFYEACNVTFDRIVKQDETDGNGEAQKRLMAAPPGSAERTAAVGDVLQQMLASLRFIVDRYPNETETLVQPSEKAAILAPLDVLEEFEKDFLETNTMYSDYENDLERFKAYVENPPLVPTLGKIHAIVDNVEFGKTENVLHDIMKLISASYLRFYRARLRISAFKGNPTINMTNPGEWYPKARAMTRNVTLHIGPTNSGKTYNALKALEAAESGYYAGPLRLLAREVYNRMKAANKKCNLITGEEVIQDYDEYGMPVKVSSGTVEMVDITNPMDVAVIDEIQMIEDGDRGWAWTQAFLGLQAKEIHLCGDPSSESIVRDLCRIAGDKLQVKRYERLSPLTVEKRPLMGELKLLRPGDCVIAFSKKDLLDWKREIEDRTRQKCAIIYGALPPESRSKQASEFNDPDNEVHYLVASDAVGMGLNLSIKRIVFLTVVKFDGKAMTRVSVSQIKQIAGRAGRFQVPGAGSSISAGGKVTAMKRGDLRYISECLAMNTPVIRKSGLFASESLFRHYTASFGASKRIDQVLEEMEVTSELNPMFYLCGVEQMTEIAALFRNIKGLSLNERITLSKAPVKTSIELSKTIFKRLCSVVAKSQSITILDIPELDLYPLSVPREHKFKITDIAAYEAMHSNIVTYLWLSYRFPMNFRDREGAMELKALCEEKIDQALSSTRKTRLAKWRRKVSGEANAEAAESAQTASESQPDAPSAHTPFSG